MHRDRTHALPPLYDLDPVVANWLGAGGAIATPNRRLARAVAHSWDRHCAAEGRAAWETPQVQPLDALLLSLWRDAVHSGRLPARTLLGNGPQRALWRRIIQDHDDGFSLLNPARAAEYCVQAYRHLLLWCLDPEDPRIAARLAVDDDCRRFDQWRRRFEEQLSAAGLITSEGAMQQLLTLPELSLSSVMLLDMDALAPLHSLLLERLSEVCHHESGSASVCLKPRQAFDDERSELVAIARWCREQTEQRPAARIAVVLQDMTATRERLEQYLRREFDCLATGYESLAVNFATGLTLDRVPLVRDALRILSLGGPRVAVDDLRALLHSRFLPALSLTMEQRRRALKSIERLGAEQLRARTLRGAFLRAIGGEVELPLLAVARRAAQQRWHRRSRLPSEWLEVFRGQLQAWEWPAGRALDSLEHQQLEHWSEALDRLAAYDMVSGAVDYDAALALLRSELNSSLFQPRTDDAAVQVLGPLETTGLRFDALWIAGMSAGRWPASPRPNPYLPRDLQRELGMPQASHDWQRARAAERWRRWTHSAEELLSSYVAREEDAAVPPSALIASLPETVGRAFTVDGERWQPIADACAVETVAMGRAPVSDQEAAAGTGSGALARQARCPFQAFAAERLQAAPRELPSPGVSRAERGTLVHRALQQLYSVFPDRETLRRSSVDSRRAAVAAALEAALSRLDPLRREVIGNTALALERDWLEELLLEWLAVDAQRQHDYRVLAREQPASVTLAGLNLQLRLDRVDSLASGERLVIDYKTGATERARRWFDTPLSYPQLPLYALVEPCADGVVIARLRPGECGFDGLGEQGWEEGIQGDASTLGAPADLQGYTQVRELWQRELTALAAAFREGSAAIEPQRDACRLCGRQSLCRVAEVGA